VMETESSCWGSAQCFDERIFIPR